MTRQYSPKTFIRKTPFELLGQYFAFRQLPFTAERRKRKRETADGIDAIIEALPREQREQVEHDFVRINELACSGGMTALCEEAAFHRIDLVAELGEHRGAHAAAMWAFLNQPNVFEVAGAFHIMDRYGGWWRRRVGTGLKPIAAGPAVDALRAAIIAEASAQGRIGPCHIDVWKRLDPLRWCFFAYPVDHPSTEVRYDDKGNLTRDVQPRVTEAVIVYRAGDGVIELHAQGQQQHKVKLAAAFCTHILGLKGFPPAIDDPYKLQPLLKDRLELKLDPADNVLAVWVKELKLDLGDKSDQVIVIPRTRVVPGSETRRFVSKTLEQSGWPIDSVRPTYAKLAFEFGSPEGGRDKRLTFTISCPDKCSLRDDPYDQIAKKYLTDWRVAPN